MSKKSLFAILIVCVLACLMTVSVFSADATEPGTGHSITYVPAVDTTCCQDGMCAYWYCSECDAYYTNSACTNETDRESLIIFNANPMTHQPAKDPCHDAGTVEYWYCSECDAVYADPDRTQPTDRESLRIDPVYELEHVAGVEACHLSGCEEYWFCPACDAVFADGAGTQQTTREALVIAPDCELAHVPAAEACHVAGTEEYWYCPECEAVYADAAGKQQTDRDALRIAPDCALEHVDAVEACHLDGMQEYWYCPECEGVYEDADGARLTDRKDLTILADCPLTHVEAVAPTCQAKGNIEYWYCQECGGHYSDAEGDVEIDASGLELEIVDHKYIDNTCHMCQRTLLDTPVIEFCYSKAQTSVRVQWTAVEGAEGYQLMRTTTPEDESSWVSAKTLVGNENTTYTNQSLTEGVTYYYRVRAYAKHANSGRVWSSYSEVDYMPAAVVLDSPYSNSDFRIRLRWNQVDGANGYQIWRMDEGGEFRVVKTIGDKGNTLTNDQGDVTAYSNVDLTSGAKYTYKMRAFHITEDGRRVYGPYSDEVVVAVQPSQPTMTLGTPKAGCVMISWNEVSNASGFQVWMSESAGGNYKIVKSVEDGSVTSYTKYSLESGKTYYFRVRAYVEVDGRKVFGAYSTTMSIRVG